MFAPLVPTSMEKVHSVVMAVGPPLALVNGSVLAIVMAHHLGGWAQGFTDHGLVAFEIAALLVLFYTTPPLVAFVVYFCFWHSIRHSIRLAARLKPSSAKAGLRAFIRHAWPMTLSATAIGTGAYALLKDRASAHAIVQVVFVGLSALTLPHVVLSWWAEARFATRREL